MPVDQSDAEELEVVLALDDLLSEPDELPPEPPSLDELGEPDDSLGMLEEVPLRESLR